MTRFAGASRWKRGCLFLLLLLALAILGAFVFWRQILAVGAKLLIEDDGPRKADVIVVLGGDGYGDRTLKGAELAKAGYAPFAVVSGMPHLMGYESADEIHFAEQRGYPAVLFREVDLPEGVESTRMEVRFLGKYLAGQGVKSILLVTSNFHSRRAAKLWRQENPKLAVRVVTSVDPGHSFTPETWWKTRVGQKMFAFEWLKTIAVMFGV